MEVLQDIYDVSPDIAASNEKRGEIIAENGPYDGFPAELLDSINLSRENPVPNYASKTFPRMQDGIGSKMDDQFEKESCDTPVREQSFQDDRILLPSQRRAINSSLTTNMDGMRSSSFWL
jgi:hypothetical protein